MPKLSSRPPKLCHHKGTNQAVVYMNGKARYLGVFDSKEAKQAYRAIVDEWSGSQTSSKPVVDDVPIVAPHRLTIAEAVVQYKAHAERYYGASRETDNLQEAIRPVREKFGFLPMSDFGPLQLRTIRNQWIEQELARNTINARVIRVKRFFKWAVSHELTDASVLVRLDSVESLMPGRGGIETKSKRAVTWEKVEATLPYLPEMVRGMVLFAWHSGARPAEVTTLTTRAVIEAEGYPIADVWVIRIDKHKTATWGHTREIPIGRSAQAVLAPWLRTESPDKPIFSPRRVDARQAKRKGKRLPGETYSRAAFQQVVRRACRRAFVHPTLGKIPEKQLTDAQRAELRQWQRDHEWSPNQLRHAFGTRIRNVGGIEASQVALGHAKPDTTLIYTSAAKERAMAAIRELG
jgi:integrase